MLVATVKRATGVLVPTATPPVELTTKRSVDEEIVKRLETVLVPMPTPYRPMLPVPSVVEYTVRIGRESIWAEYELTMPVVVVVTCISTQETIPASSTKLIGPV